jgi:hypothetical protein
LKQTGLIQRQTLLDLAGRGAFLAPLEAPANTDGGVIALVPRQRNMKAL